MKPYLGIADINALIAKLGVRPQKRYGQNFVTDPNTIKKIVNLAGISSGDQVLEIGGGLGSLTLGLLNTGAKVTVIEIDSILAQQLPQTAANHLPDLAQNLLVIEKDATKISKSDLDASLSFKLPNIMVANLPYNIAVPIIMHTFNQIDSVKNLIIMVQLEVAERILAQPKTKIYGAPTVKINFFARAKMLSTVGKNVFYPKPRVNSALIKLERFDDYIDDLTIRKELVFKLIDTAFLQRRKMLRSSLKDFIGNNYPQFTHVIEIDDVIKEAGLALTQRAEELAISDYVALSQVIDRKISTYEDAI